MIRVLHYHVVRISQAASFLHMPSAFPILHSKHSCYVPILSYNIFTVQKPSPDSGFLLPLKSFKTSR